MSTIIIRDAGRLYELVREQEGLVLTVVCGTVGWYQRKLNLTMDEADHFGRQGKAFIDELAISVASDPQKYADRLLS